jgi:hypothetical protein
MLLQPIDATDEGRFARTGRTADDHPLACSHPEADIPQDVKRAIPFVDADELDR